MVRFEFSNVQALLAVTAVYLVLVGVLFGVYREGLYGELLEERELLSARVADVREEFDSAHAEIEELYDQLGVRAEERSAFEEVYRERQAEIDALLSRLAIVQGDVRRALTDRLRAEEERNAVHSELQVAVLENERVGARLAACESALAACSEASCL